MKPKAKQVFYRILAIAFILLAWKLLAMNLHNKLVLPAPGKTLEDFIALLLSGSFYHALGFTLLRGLIGFVLAFLLAAALGIPAGLNRSFNAFLGPFIVITRSTPVISFILLALIWIGPENVPVFIGLLTMFPLLCTSFIGGIQNTDRELTGMASVYKVGRARVIRELYIPSLLPFLFNGMSNAIGFGWRAVIIGEVLSQPRWGMGTEMQVAQTYLLVSNVICWTIVAVLTGYLFEWILRLAARHALKWKEAEAA